MSRKTTEPVASEALAYDLAEAGRLDGLCRSTHFKAVDPCPKKRGDLPLLTSFKVGRRRLVMAADHRAWLEALRAAGG